MMTLSKPEWHQRYKEQAYWTQAIREYLFSLVHLDCAKRVVEIGCGSGAVLEDLSRFTKPVFFGLDIDSEAIILAMRNTPFVDFINGDAHQLPLASSSFDLTFCHFLLLWVGHPLQVLHEMIRITTSGGYVCIFAEPDYGGRIDFPDHLSLLGKMQSESLISQGANPYIGRQLRGLLAKAGLEDIVTGVLGGQWGVDFNRKKWESEWNVLISDLMYDSVIQVNVNEVKTQDHKAWVSGERVLYVPTFYGWGKVPA